MVSTVPPEQIVDNIVGKLNSAIEAFKAEIDKRFDERDTTLCGKLENQITEAQTELKKEIEDRQRTYSLPGSEPVGDPEKDFSFCRAARAIVQKDWTLAPREREVFQSMAKATGTDVDSQAGYLVPVQQITDVIELLRADVVAFQLGAQMLDGLSGSPVFIPRQTGTTTGYWIGENPSSNITTSDPTVEQVSMTPHTLASLVVVSNLFMELSQPAAESFIRGDIAQQFARTLDSGILLGTGASGQPLGIVNQSGVSTSTLAGPSYNQLNDIIHAVRNANALKGKLGWALSPSQYNAIIQMLDAGTTQPLARRVVAEGPLTSLLGYPFALSTQLPAAAATSAAIFGAWDNCVVGQWAGMRLTASDSAGNSFERDQTQIRGTLRVDMMLRQPTAFCAAA